MTYYTIDQQSRIVICVHLLYTMEYTILLHYAILLHIILRSLSPIGLVFYTIGLLLIGATQVRASDDRAHALL